MDCGLYYQRIAFTRAQSAILQGPDFNLRVELARKSLIHEANISKTDPVTLLFNAKTYSTARTECMWKIKKKNAEWKFLNLEISIFLISAKSTPQNFFLIFSVSSSVCNKRIFIKKIWGHWLSF